MAKRNIRNRPPAGSVLRQWRARGYTVELVHEPQPYTVRVTGPKPSDPAKLEAWLAKPANERALRHDLVAELQLVAGLSSALRDGRVKIVRDEDSEAEVPLGRVSVRWVA